MDKYIKGATLGQGTFGIVFKATHKEVLALLHAKCMSFKITASKPLPVAYRLGKLLLLKRSTLERLRKVSTSQH